MVILSQPRTKVDPPVFKDATTTSLRVVADFFKNYGSGLNSSGATITIGPPAIQHQAQAQLLNFNQGVQIASRDDVVLHGRMKFTEVQVPLGHEIFASKSTEISRHMEIPLLVKKIGGFRREDLGNGNQLGINAFQNRTALYLNMEASLSGEKWGYADFIEWNKTIGTVLVVRQDKNALTAPHVESIATYCKLELCELMGELGEGFYNAEGEPKSMQDIRKAKESFIKAYMSKEAVEKYFYGMKQKRVDAGDGAWEYATSPYLD
ncbi:hypothetical protein BKA65DRAFT_515328 [Rhexocercosporidium sp. MPI-PUGE-AT-0058]|nr:hypothetical protein BKA65DRAFT_515328 [Rhexocercosporidium sp. MPI-PUGE-AT-0058]